MLEPLDINGDPPVLNGLPCDEMLCQEFWCRGELCDPANVIYLSCGGSWHRLYFDCGIVFWRLNDGHPETWAAGEEGWAYPLVDIAARFSFKSAIVEHVETATIEGGSRVSFVFRGGRRVVFENVADRTRYYLQTA